VAATCIAAFEVLEEQPQLTEQLWANTRFFKQGLKRLGFNTGVSETPITPVIVGEAAVAHEFSRELFSAGVFAQSIGYPTVPLGKSRIRTIVTATHTQEQLARALEILEKVGKKLKII
jgi:glycine C-acetyltransferase